MHFKIYGSGCSKCQQLAANTETAAQALGIDCAIEKVTDMSAIIDAGVMRTPALGVHDQIVVEGRVASADEIRRLIE